MGGAQHCWWVRWVCLNLHAWHGFTHAVATDGSLKTYADGVTRLAVGLWDLRACSWTRGCGSPAEATGSSDQ